MSNSEPKRPFNCSAVEPNCERPLPPKPHLFCHPLFFLSTTAFFFFFFFWSRNWPLRGSLSSPWQSPHDPFSLQIIFFKNFYFLYLVFVPSYHFMMVCLISRLECFWWQDAWIMSRLLGSCNCKHILNWKTRFVSDVTLATSTKWMMVGFFFWCRRPFSTIFNCFIMLWWFDMYHKLVTGVLMCITE